MPPATEVIQSTPLKADVDAVDVTAVDVKVIIELSMQIEIYNTSDVKKFPCPGIANLFNAHFQ
jgi:hypothetical protein